MAKGHKGRRVGCAATAGSNLSTSLIQPEQIEHVILLVRGRRVMLDRDLAALYGVETKQLKRAVRRNIDRFPEDFMFQITVA
jgi:hypothetical protein